MHTSVSLQLDMFSIEIDGRAADVAELLDWQPHDRLGIVLTEPLGALGASALMQLAIVSYFNARASRRAVPHYAEIYLFHLGGPYGDFSNFDIVPTRKEVFLPDDPAAAIEAINDRAITHLAVPQGERAELSFPWKEADTARDRIRRCFLYAAGGRVTDSDISIAVTHENPLEDVQSTIDPDRMLALMPTILERTLPENRASSIRWANRLLDRRAEVSVAQRDAVALQREAISESGLPRETYRRASVDEALGVIAGRKNNC